MPKFLFLIATFLLLGLGSQAQEELPEEMERENYPTKIPEKISPSLEGDFKMPTPLSNKAFRKIGNGIGDINLMFQYPIANFISIGAGFKFGYYQFVDFLTNNSFSNSGKLFCYSPYGKITYTKFSNPRLFFQFGVKAGYSFMNFNSFTCTNAGENGKKQDLFFIEPQIGVNIFVDENLAFSLVVSDNIGFNNFNPSLMCLETFNGYSTSDSEGNYNIMGIGFGFTYYFHKKNSKN